MHQHPAVGLDNGRMGGKESFTCEHTLVSGDKPEYTNVATIEGGGKEKPSNKVVVEVEEPDFSIEKLQRISGSFTKERLRGEIGQTVQYEVIVRNTGNTNLEIEGLRDANCTNLGGGASETASANPRPGRANTS